MNFQGVSFNYAPLLPAGGLEATLRPSAVFTDGPMQGFVVPEMIQFAQPHQPDYAFPQIRIFSVQSLADQDRAASVAYWAAQDLTLARQRRLPLPYWHATPIGRIDFLSQVTPLSFQNGAGVRYLGQLTAFAVMPIAADALVYSFQGVTQDGKYYVSVNWPVKGPAAMPMIDEMLLDNEHYYTHVQYRLDWLNAAGPGEFTPPLAQLDALVASLLVNPTGFPTPGSAPAEPPAACTYGMEYVADVTIPDNTLIPAGTEFVKTWRVRNSGTCPWTDVAMMPTDLNQPLDFTAINPGLIDAAPGAELDVSVTFHAPLYEGNYTSHWRLKRGCCSFVGPEFYAQIQVPAEGATPFMVPGAPHYGQVSGQIDYMGEGPNPALTLYFRDVRDAGKRFTLTTEAGWTHYENYLPAGEYYVYARDANGLGGAFTRAAICRRNHLGDCADHALVSVVIGPNAVSPNINVSDWNVPQDTIPQP
jgi:hypothetical protein